MQCLEVLRSMRFFAGLMNWIEDESKPLPSWIRWVGRLPDWATAALGFILVVGVPALTFALTHVPSVTVTTTPPSTTVSTTVKTETVVVSVSNTPQPRQVFVEVTKSAEVSSQPPTASSTQGSSTSSEPRSTSSASHASSAPQVATTTTTEESTPSVATAPEPPASSTPTS